MRLGLLCFISILTTLLTGCSTMNSNFSCNVTAGDSCLTIEQVDAMTRFANDVKTNPPRRGMMKAENNLPNNPGKIIQQNNGQSLWVARNLEAQSWV
ncbi:TPA: conjugal transfer protein [Legionella bozemanae]